MTVYLTAKTILVMDTLGFSTPYKVRQCSQCQGETEFYCNTCKHDLCLQCKERHVIDLDTIYHDVVIYREKYEYIPIQETCERHPGGIYEMFCHSCERPVCFQCKEHRKHKILDIRTAYKTNRQQHREIIHNIRNETLYNSCFLLAGIKTDIKTCHTEISNSQSEMSTKAQRLKILIDTVICNEEIALTSYIMYVRKKQQKEKIQMNRHLASIENYEHRFEQGANRPMKFLLFLKKTRGLNIKSTDYPPPHPLLSLIKEINTEDVIKLLSEIQILETGKRQVRYECLLQLMSTPVLHRYVTVTGISGVIHISCVTPDRVWISDNNNLILTNTEGDTLYHLTDVIQYSYGVHTVNITGDLIYINRDYNLNKLSKDTRAKSTLIKYTKPCRPWCVYCSPSNGDLLVGMVNTDTYTEGMVTRYNNTGQHIQTIQHNNAGQKLYIRPEYITENRNGDVIVSDYFRGVVVTEIGGRHRFSYTGPPLRSGLTPCGICTDALSHILVCDYKTHSVQMIDKDGHFLSLILTQENGIYRPQSLSYDDKYHFIWLGLWNDNRVCIYRYIERQDYLTSSCN